MYYTAIHIPQNQRNRCSLGTSFQDCCQCPLFSCDTHGRGLHTLEHHSTLGTRCTFSVREGQVKLCAGHDRERCGRMVSTGLHGKERSEADMEGVQLKSPLEQQVQVYLFL